MNSPVHQHIRATDKRAQRTRQKDRHIRHLLRRPEPLEWDPPPLLLHPLGHRLHVLLPRPALAQDGARRDGVDADALGAQELRELLHVLELGGFAGAVGGGGAAVELTAHEGGLDDDGGGGGVLEVGEGGGDEGDEAHDVDGEAGVPGFGAAVHVHGGCCG